MAAQTDFWGDLQLSPVITPVMILREQAALLGAKTHRQIEASVETRASDGIFYHSFNLVVPALDNYTYQLFRICHGIDLYPVLVETPRGALKMHSEYDFLLWLREKLSSQSTKQVISSILGQIGT